MGRKRVQLLTNSRLCKFCLMDLLESAFFLLGRIVDQCLKHADIPPLLLHTNEWGTSPGTSVNLKETCHIFTKPLTLLTVAYHLKGCFINNLAPIRTRLAERLVSLSCIRWLFDLASALRENSSLFPLWTKINSGDGLAEQLHKQCHLEGCKWDTSGFCSQPVSPLCLPIRLVIFTQLLWLGWGGDTYPGNKAKHNAHQRKVKPYYHSTLE